MAKRKLTKGRALIEISGRPSRISRSLKRIQRKTPGGWTVTHYKYKKTGKHVCAICKNVLHGKPRGSIVEISRLPKSQRRPERPFGGMLCSACSRQIISLRAKLKYKEIKPEDIPISLKEYVR